MKKILIMGLPGAGKTTFAKEIVEMLRSEGYAVTWFNADDIRREYNDWDFSRKGRLRQAARMWALSEKEDVDYVIADFVAPLEEMREIFDADFTVWIDTIEAGRFEDTNKAFVIPNDYDVRVFDKGFVTWSEAIGKVKHWCFTDGQ